MNVFRADRWSMLTKQGGVALIYLLLARATQAAFPGYEGGVSIFWPPSGVALATLLIGGHRLLPGVYGGAWLANLAAGHSLPVSALLAVGHTFEPFLGNWLLDSLKNFRRSLDTPRDYLWLNGVGALTAGIGATAGVAALALTGGVGKSQLADTWLNWWQGDFLGIITIAPLVLVWQVRPVDWLASRTRMFECAAYFGLLTLVGQTVFVDWFADSLGLLARRYWTFPLVFWAALRGGRHGVTVTVALVSVQALFGVSRGLGIFAEDFQKARLTEFWIYATSLTVVGMMLALVVSRHRRAEEQLGVTQFAMDHASEAIYWIRPDAGFAYVNDAACQALQYSRAELLAMTVADVDPVFSAEWWAAHWQQLRARGAMTFESTHRRKDGSVFHVEIAATHRHFAGQEFDFAFVRDITERKLAEQAREASERRFRSLANAAPLLIWVSGPDGACQWFSQGWLTFTGRLLEDELGTGWMDGVHPDDRQRCRDLYASHFDRRQPFQLEFRLRHRRGEYRWIHSSGMPRFGDRGEFMGYIGSCVDVSEVRQAQDELVKRQRLLDEAQHIAHLGSWDWNIVDGEISWSDEAAAIFVPDDKATPPSLAAFMQAVHPDDRQRVGEAVDAALLRDVPYDIRYRVVSESRGERVVHAEGKVYRGTDGEAVRMVGTVHDLTDHLRAESAARAAQEQLQSMTAAVPGVVYQFLRTAAGEWKFLYLSKGIEELYEVSAEEAYRNHDSLTRCILEEDRASHREAGERSAATLSIWEHEHRIRTQRGHVKWVRGRATPQLRADGSILWNGILADITEQKRAEEALRLSASVFAHAQESIIITDADCNIIDVNSAFTHSTGYARDEVVGANPRILKSGQQSAEFYQELWDRVVRAGKWSGELWNRRKDGQCYAELLTISAVRNSRGEVTHYVGVSTDITHIKEHERQLEHTAHFDALTGIPNRHLLADRMRQAIAQAERNCELMGVCYLDLDGFKPINDSMGHEAGDLVLIEVARRIAATIRRGDTVARLGGDEFVILIVGLPRKEEYVATLERLLAAISQPIGIEGQAFCIGASIGVSLFPENAEDPDTLLRQADQAMYVAKQSGKNRFHLYP
ncbi:MAG: PAS domain S-box protein [Methylococcaceae bacterium]|nr:PAS domain S-box protein [Methylococcaceae bacterium]